MQSQNSTKLTPRPSFIAGFLLLVLLFLSALVLPSVAQPTDTLPDLGEPTANSGSVQPNMSAQGAGFNFHNRIDGKQITLTPQYSKQNGSAIGGSLASPVSTNMAVGVLFTVGSDKNEWLLNTGFDLTSNQRFILSLGQLRQKQDFSFISGTQKAQVRQDNGAVSYQYFLGKTILNAAEVNAYISDTGSVDLEDKTYYTDTASLYELWSDPRRIAGGRVSGVQGRLVFTPTTQSTFKLGFGGERLRYDYLTGNDSTTRATGSAEFNQRLDHDFNLRASANAGASQSRYALGLGKRFTNGSQLGLDVANIQGRDNTFNDKQVMLSYTQSFGGNSTNNLSSNLTNNASSSNGLDTASMPVTPEATHASSQTWASALVDQVARRPSFLPAQAIAKIDTTATPTRLVVIDKTALPSGSSIDTTTGNITTPIGTAVSSIAGVTKNSIAFSNAGQFALSGGSLVIAPNLIAQPAAGSTDTYVVTMNNTSGGGTTLATVTVSPGSTKIDSVVISSGQIAPTISGFNAISKTYGDAAFSLTAPTSNSSGAFTYSSSNTAVATISGSTVTIVGAGTSTITATQAADGAYSSGTTTATLTVAAASQATLTASASNITIVSITGTSTLSTSGGSGSGAVTYSNTGACTISGTTLTAGSADGTCTVTATKAADSNYAVATATVSITVSATAPTLSGFNAISKTYGDAAFSLTAPTSNSSGAFTYTSSNTAVATISGSTVTVVGAGTSTITATQAADGAYSSGTATATLTVAKATQATLTASASSTTIVSLTGTSTLSTSGGSGTGAVSYSSTNGCTISGTTLTAGSSVGTCTVTATKAADSNYAVATATVSITVSATAPTLSGFNAISKTYGDAAFSLTAPTSNSSGAFTYTSSNTAVATISGSTVTVVGAGTSTITATQAADGAYSSGTATATLTVAKATPVISAMSNLSLYSYDAYSLCIESGSGLCSASGFDPAITATVAMPSSTSPGQFNVLQSSNTAALTPDALTQVTPSTYYLYGTIGQDYTYVQSSSRFSAMSATVTLVQAATANYTSATVSFTLTLTPSGDDPSSGASCYNTGILRLTNFGSTEECLCPTYSDGSYLSGTMCENYNPP